MRAVQAALAALTIILEVVVSNGARAELPLGDFFTLDRDQHCTESRVFTFFECFIGQATSHKVYRLFIFDFLKEDRNFGSNDIVGVANFEGESNGRTWIDDTVYVGGDVAAHRSGFDAIHFKPCNIMSPIFRSGRHWIANVSGIQKVSYIPSGLPSNILIGHSDSQRLLSVVQINKGKLDRGHPCPLTSNEIFASNEGRIFCGLGLNGSGFGKPFVGLYEGVGLRSGASHLGQLSVKNDVLRYSYSDGNEGQNSNRPSGPCRTRGCAICGGLLFLFGAALLKIAFYIFDGPHEPRRLRGLGWFFGSASVFLVVQGTVLALTGNWWS